MIYNPVISYGAYIPLPDRTIGPPASPFADLFTSCLLLRRSLRFFAVKEFLLRLRCSPLYINRHQSLGRIGKLKIGVLIFLNFVVSSRNLACR